MIKSLVIVLVLLLGILQFRLWHGNGNIRDILRLRKAIEQQTQELTRLKERNQSLNREIMALKANPAMLEDRARVELGMIKQGETFCLVIEPANKTE